jgi:hypothetical protein
MKQLSDELNTGIGQKFKYLMKYSSILFISSVFVPLLCLLLPEMGIIYILQFILFLVFIIISCKIFLGLKDVINL